MDEHQSEIPHQRRKRYKGTHPRSFREKYKEHDPLKYKDDVEKVIARGDTPAGMHRSICVPEILSILNPQPGETAIDATLGYGGHAREILKRIVPGGRLVALDADPAELSKTRERLATEGFGAAVFSAYNANFATLDTVVAKAGLSGADMILADLGLSSMQIDNPERGFTFKRAGPLDMRMNQNKGKSAAELLNTISEQNLTTLLISNADEGDAAPIAAAITAQQGKLHTTSELAAVIRGALTPLARSAEEQTKAVRRTFQAIRIAVNSEFKALDSFLECLPACLNQNGRVAILTFHSGEDNRVVKAFEEGKRAGLYRAIQDTEIRAGREERYSNPRSTSARLRWAIRA